jgi:hypothetical protein
MRGWSRNFSIIFCALLPAPEAKIAICCMRKIAGYMGVIQIFITPILLPPSPKGEK